MNPKLMELIAKAKSKVDAKSRKKTLKVEEGRSRYRILPPVSDDADFYQDYGQHFVKGADGALKAVYLCVDKTFGKPCQVCSAVEMGIKSVHDDALVKILGEAKANARVLFNVLHVDGKTPNEPEILEVAPTVFNEVVRLLTEWEGTILDLEKGRDVIIERTGKGLNTKYSVQVAAKESPVPNAAEVMKKAVNLHEWVRQENEDAMNRALANVSAVAGLLPPAGAVGALGSPSIRDVLIEDEDPTLAIGTASAPEVLAPEPVAAVGAAPVAASAPAAAPTTAPAASSTGDSDLDELLASLG